MNELTLRITDWSLQGQIPVLENMCCQIRKYGDKAEVGSKEGVLNKKPTTFYAVFRDPRSLKYPVYQSKGYKSGYIL